MSVLADLRSAFGDDCLREHEPHEIDGAALTATFAPADPDTLARGLALLGERGASAVVSGGGTQLALGNLPVEPSLILSTRHLSGVDTFDPEDGVVHAGAGTPLYEVRDTVRAGGWELPMEAASHAATLGGLIAAAAVGPRVTQFGPPRDQVLGLEVALATGERTHCGGRVVKNVTGYDLAKLYTGSFGSLGVIEGAWLRLRPRPATVSTWCAPIGEDDAADLSALAACRLASARAAVVMNRTAAGRLGLPVSSGGGGCLWLELAGAAAATANDAAWLTSELDAEACRDASSAVHGFMQQPLGDHGLRARIAVRPTAVGRVARALDAAAFDVVSHPAVGLVYASRQGEGGAELTASEARSAIEAIEAAAAGDPSANLRFESLPVFAKQERDVFGVDPVAAELGRGLKQRFDPKGVLNRGRAPGGV